jgi:creatinine amidohydrolase
MPGRLLKMEELSSGEFESLDRERTIFILPISPLEAHGPHLPLGVDFFNALYFAERIGGLIIKRRPDSDVVIFPGVPLGTNVYRLPGSVKTDAISIYKMVLQFGQSIGAWGFKNIFVVSGHGSPKHIVAIDSACLKSSRKYRSRMHNLSGRLALRFLKGEFSGRISDLMPLPIPEDKRELLKIDFHGGWWETSMMLLLRPDLVKAEYKNLPGNKRVKGDKSGDMGYFGYPALADADFAEASMKVVSAEAILIVEGILDGKIGHTETISPLFRIAALRPYFLRYLVISVSLLILAIVVVLLLL